MNDDTEAIADARETRQLVLARVLQLAARVIEKVADDSELHFAVIEDRLPAGGFEWRLTASTGNGHDFVRVAGMPDPTEQGPVVPVEVMAQIMGNQSASFDTQIPVEWVKLASRAAEMVG